MLSNLLNYWLFIKKVSGEISTDAFSLFLKSFCFTFPLRRINFMWKGSIVFLLVSELKAVCFEVISVPVQEILNPSFCRSLEHAFIWPSFPPFASKFSFYLYEGEKKWKLIVRTWKWQVILNQNPTKYCLHFSFYTLYSVILPTLSCISSQ